MRAKKSEGQDLFKNPIKNLPNLIKAVKEEKLKKAKAEKKDSKKTKYVMKDKLGLYIL